MQFDWPPLWKFVLPCFDQQSAAFCTSASLAGQLPPRCIHAISLRARSAKVVQVNAVTKSGTNDWRCGAWEFNRDASRQTTNYFATTKPALRQNQYGGSFGGPIEKNHAFFFGYYEGFNNRQGTTDNRVVLSQVQRSGDFSGGAAIRDPLTGLPFLGNVIPANRISPIATAILNQYIPLPNVAANRVVRSPNVQDTREQLGTRFDFRVNDQHTLLARYTNLEFFEWTYSGKAVVAAILGGTSSLAGPFAGMAFYLVMAEHLARYFQQFAIVFGVLLLVVIRVAPDGLYVTVARWLSEELERRSRGS